MLDPAPPATADATCDPAGNLFRLRRREKVRRLGQLGTGKDVRGRLIRHAGLAASTVQASTVQALAGTMVETSFETLLMTTVGFAALQPPGFLPAMRAAITLAAIAVAAKIEHPATGWIGTKTLAEDRGTGNGQRFPGSIAVFVGEEAVEDAAPWKSPRAGLSHCAWKSRKGSGISTSPTIAAATVNFAGSTAELVTGRKSRRT